MTDYANGKNILLRRPEPGRPVHPIQKIEHVTVAQPQIDTNAIADAVIKAISFRVIPGTEHMGPNSGGDTFDSSGSLKKLADVMSNQGQAETNLDGLGYIRETKKDKKETDKAIDMLSKLGD